jgi:hypothetical protein
MCNQLTVLYYFFIQLLLASNKVVMGTKINNTVACDEFCPDKAVDS